MIAQATEQVVRGDVRGADNIIVQRGSMGLGLVLQADHLESGIPLKQGGTCLRFFSG
jgi:hypothetical protein